MLKDYCLNCNTEWIPDDSQFAHFCPQCWSYSHGQYDAPPVALLNTSICTVDGKYELKSISLDAAKRIIGENDILSAIGHDSTAQILSDLLSIPVPVNRINFEQQPNQMAIVFKLNGRPPEGKILSREEIEQIGYSFKLLFRTK